MEGMSRAFERIRPLSYLSGTIVAHLPYETEAASQPDEESEKLLALSSSGSDYDDDPEEGCSSLRVRTEENRNDIRDLLVKVQPPKLEQQNRRAPAKSVRFKLPKLSSRLRSLR